MSNELLLKAITSVSDDKVSDANKIMTKITTAKISDALNKKVKQLEKTMVNKLK